MRCNVVCCILQRVYRPVLFFRAFAKAFWSGTPCSAGSNWFQDLETSKIRSVGRLLSGTLGLSSVLDFFVCQAVRGLVSGYPVC